MTPEQIADEAAKSCFDAQYTRADKYKRFSEKELSKVVLDAIMRALLVVTSKDIVVVKSVEHMFEVVIAAIEAASDKFPAPNDGLECIAKQHMIMAMADLDKALANVNVAQIHHARAVAEEQRSGRR